MPVRAAFTAPPVDHFEQLTAFIINKCLPPACRHAKETRARAKGETQEWAREVQGALISAAGLRCLGCNDKAIKTLGHIIHSGQLKCTKTEKAPSVDSRRQTANGCCCLISREPNRSEYVCVGESNCKCACGSNCKCACVCGSNCKCACMCVCVRFVKQSHQINHSMHLHKFSVGHFGQRQQIRRAGQGLSEKDKSRGSGWRSFYWELFMQAGRQEGRKEGRREGEKEVCG